MIADLQWRLGSSADDAGIAVAPIMSIPAKDTHLAALNHHLRAVAIVFDFVNPVLPLWRLIDRGSKLWLNESEAGVLRETLCSTHKEEARTVDARASSALQGERDGGRGTITTA